MANLTVRLDERLLRRARARALEQGTSVNALVADYLERFAGVDPAVAALAGFLKLAASVDAGSGPEGRSWRRADLYDRSLLR